MQEIPKQSSPQARPNTESVEGNTVDAEPGNLFPSAIW